VNNPMNNPSQIIVSPVYLANYKAFFNPNYKIITNQGGTRSGKTYSIIQLLIQIAQKEKCVISIVSKTLPHLKRGAIRDFQKIMTDWNCFEEKSFNKSELIYRFSNGSFIEFFSADDSAKLRGPGRDYLFINEVNLLSYDEWIQLTLRTRKKTIIDYNPVDEFSWIYDKILKRDDCKFIQSSYLDNYDFLTKEMIKEIERLRVEDENYWQIFGLGNIAQTKNIIYNKFANTDKEPSGEIIYGLDFGYNNPTALVRVSKNNDQLYVKELLYETKLTNSDLIEYLNKLIKNKTDYIYADSAEPQRIQEIHQAGFNIWPSDKNVKAGIDFCKRFFFNIYKDSTNLQKEIKSYKWKEDKNGIILEEPVKYNDHLLDALRYTVFTHGLKYWFEQQLAFPNVHLNKVFRKDKFAGY